MRYRSLAERDYERLLTFVIGLIFFALYAMTTAPSIVELYDDSLEFQLVGPTFAIAHPTGYPLYTLLGGLWSRVLFPFGNWAWRMNLFSAVAAATTVALLFMLTQRLTKQYAPAKSPALPSIWPGLAAVVTFGLAPNWWSQATIAEVYALHNLFVAAILLVALNLAITQSPCHLVTFLALLFGLALTHHRTSILLPPGVAILLWGQRPLWRPSRHWLRWGGALLTPLLLYLWLPLRAVMGVHDLHGSYVNSWSGFWDHVLARGYTGFFQQNALTVHRTVGDWWQLGGAQIGWVALGLGVGGIGWLLWQGRPRRLWLGLLVVLLTNLLFAVNYQVGDQEVFLLPVWLCFALFVGVGVSVLGQLQPTAPAVAQGLMISTFLLLLTGIGGRGVWVNRSQAWATHDYAVAVAKVDFPPDSRVIALEGQATALAYMQAAEGLGRNAVALVANLPADRQAALAAALAQGYPTYITQEIEGIAEQYSFSGEGPLVRVWPRGKAQTDPPRKPLAQAFADQALHLIGYDLEWLAEAGGPTLRVAFYWQPTRPLPHIYKLSLRLLDAQGEILTAEDRYPLRLAAPTTSWLPGETIRDVHYLKAPVALSGVQQLRVILYDAASIAEAGAVDLPTLP